MSEHVPPRDVVVDQAELLEDAIASAKSRAAAVYASDPPSLVRRISREAWATWDASDEIVLIRDDSDEQTP